MSGGKPAINASTAIRCTTAIGWIHVARIGAWREILAEILAEIEASGLLEATGSVTACACGPPGDYPWPRWATAVDLGPDLALGECPTLRRLWDRARADPAGAAWYVHTKGVSRPGSRNVAAWRRYMLHFAVTRWRDCLDAMAGHDLAGVDYVEPGDAWWEDYPPPNPAFLGNFWWARLDYLARLPPGRVDLSRTRWSAEWDFVGAGSPRVRCFHHSRRNLYLDEIRPSEYDGPSRDP